MASAPVTAAARGAEVGVPVLRSVLVATDFSDAGNRAVPQAFSLLPNGGTVHLVHVGGPGTGQDGEAQEHLRQLVPHEGARPGLEVRVEALAGGDVAETLLRAAGRLDVDVICLGTHGRSGLKKVLLGSVTQTVMSRANRPVLLVRPPEE